MVKTCSDLNCAQKCVKTSNISFHRFPKNPELCKIWLTKIGRNDFVPTPYSFLCSKHFKHEDFERTFPKKVLKNNAIPSIIPKKELKCKRIIKQPEKKDLKPVDFSCKPSTESNISVTDTLSTAQPDKASSIVKNWKKICYGNFTVEDLKKSEQVKLKWEGLSELTSQMDSIVSLNLNNKQQEPGDTEQNSEDLSLLEPDYFYVNQTEEGSDYVENWRKPCSSNITRKILGNVKVKKKVSWEYSRQIISKKNSAVQSCLDFSKLQKNVQNLRCLIRKSEEENSHHSSVESLNAVYKNPPIYPRPTPLKDRRKAYLGDFKYEDLEDPVKVKSMWICAKQVLSKKNYQITKLRVENSRLKKKVNELKIMIQYLKETEDV